ncbi:hypothetical protein C3L33_03957, partial [Rhododendron williamsianum]
MGKEEEEWFKRGAEVEVSFNEQGFRGSWYTGTVLRTVSKKNNKIFIEFHTLKADDKKASKPLRQFVDLVDVRPLAPRELSRSFNLSDLVDAFHNDGWWEGTVTDVIHHHHHNSNNSTSSSTYSVFFRSSREQIEFHESDLRLHREWDHGNWKPQLEPQLSQPPTSPSPPPPPPQQAPPARDN